jgi:hypothetical protein
MKRTLRISRKGFQRLHLVRGLARNALELKMQRVSCKGIKSNHWTRSLKRNIARGLAEMLGCNGLASNRDTWGRGNPQGRGISWIMGRGNSLGLGNSMVRDLAEMGRVEMWQRSYTPIPPHQESRKRVEREKIIGGNTQGRGEARIRGIGNPLGRRNSRSS